MTRLFIHIASDFSYKAADCQGFSELFVSERGMEVWGLAAPKLILSQLLRKTLFFLYYNLAGLFSRGCLTQKLVDSAKLHNTDLRKRTQNVPVLSQFFKARTAGKEQADQEGL